MNMKHAIRQLLRRACAVMLLLAVVPAFGQTCANPLPIVSGGLFTGITCSSIGQLPAIANGAIQIPGLQVIYALSDLSASYLDLTLTMSAQPNTLSLFVCRNPCSTYTSCVAIADTGSPGTAIVHLDKPAEYFLVVGSANNTCSQYSLTVNGTLND